MTEQAPGSDVSQQKAAPLAIIGIGCLFPKAANHHEFWSNIRSGVDAITEIPSSHWAPDDYFHADSKKPDFTYARRGGFITPVDFDPLEYGMPPNVLEATDTSQLLGMYVASEALKDAGYGAGKAFDRDRVSVILGVTGTLELVIPLGARLGHPIWRRALADAGVDADTAEDVVRRIGDSYVPWQENSFPGLLGNVVAGRISKHLDLGGTNCVVDAACASSLSAIHLAALELSAGRSDMVITGGVDTFNDIFMYMCFSKTPALSPTGDAKPFDAKGDGTILGEGLGVVVLKRLADAERDGDHVYAVIKSIGTSSDGKGEAIYAPSASGQKKALRDAYTLAGVKPDTIELVEAHGTGTRVGDAVEASALKEVYGATGREDTWCAVGSVKSQVGHTKAAAGVAGLIKAALALDSKTLPPTIKVDRPLDELREGPLYVNTTKRPWVGSPSHPRRAALSAFGFGGSNFHCVLEEADSKKRRADWDGDVQIFAFSGSSASVIRQALDGIDPSAKWDVLRADAAASRRAFDASAPSRLLFVVERDKTDLSKLISTAQRMLERSTETSWSTPDGAFYGSGPADGQLGILFPGQGSQYVGMLRDLACQFPEMLEALEEANRVFATEGETRRLSDLIYPKVSFSEEEKERQEEELRSIEVAQPAIGAVGIGALRVLRSFGIEADAVAGHSYGELMALCAAGRFDAQALCSLSRVRARLMASSDGEKGAMLAVRAPLAAVESLVEEEKLEVVLANRNAPTQAVLSGSVREIERAGSACSTRNIQSKRIAVAAAFHSPLVAHAREPFLTALRAVPFHEATVPVFANTSAAEYPADHDEARNLLAEQLASPVDFVSEIDAMYERGVRTFVEVGPAARLTGLVHSILDGRKHLAVALDASSGGRSNLVDLARLLSQLAADGRTLSLISWDGNFVAPTKKKSKMTLSISGANYVTPREKRPATASPAMAAAQTIAPAGPLSTTTSKSLAVPSPQPPTPSPKTNPSPQPPAPSTQTAPKTATNPDFLRFTQDSLLALQKMQEQTAKLHSQFLAGQEAAARTFQALLEQQSRILGLTGSDTSLQPAYAPVQIAPAPLPVPEEVREPAMPKVEVPPQPVVAAPSRHVELALLEVISQKTGYPTEMLEFDMTLDADLGIDSIKRVEILSALEERLPSAPKITAEHLGRLHTLRSIVEHLAAAGLPDVAVEKPAAADGQAAAVLIDIISTKTGYPTEMLELDMSLDGDLGIDSIKRVEILSALEERLPGSPKITADDLGRIRTLRNIVDHLSRGTAPATSPAKPAADVASVLLSIVSAKTGYPTEMLELSMSLDSDLGIDSIKRVEILSALEEQLPDSPRIEAEHLGKLQTLASIVEHLSQSQRTASPSRPANPSSVPAADCEKVLLEIVASKTGYPVEMLELDMSLDADLGIDSIKRVEILSAVEERLPNAAKIEAEHLGRLQTLRAIAAHLSQSSGAASVAPRTAEKTVTETPNEKPAEKPIQHLKRSTVTVRPLLAARPRVPLAEKANVTIIDDGSALSPALAAAFGELGLNARLTGIATDVSDSDVVVMLSPDGGTDAAFLRSSVALAKRLGPSLRTKAASTGAVFATISRLDGQFGFGSEVGDTLAGGLAGLTKTAAREWAGVSAKAIDLPSRRDVSALAASIAEEILLEGPVEVGISEAGRFELVLADVVTGPNRHERLSPSDVVVITGGARGVTAEVAVAIAGRYKSTLLLLGRSPLPEPEPSWLERATEERDIKKALMQSAPGSPREIQKKYERVVADREIRRTMERVASAGGKVVYRSVDARDAAAVKHTLAEVRRALGPIRGLIHGAGVLADRLIEEKTAEQFDSVFSTKVDALQNLLEATLDDRLSVIALFSSSTARFGRVGQVDYAMANEVLNKIAQRESKRRTDCRVVSMNWGPWSGGMVNAALAALFEKEGVGLIDLSAGASLLVDTIESEGPVEIVVLAEASGGAKAIEEPSSVRPTESAFSVDLNTEDFPFLRSHVLGGRAVLPVAMIMEWLAHAATVRNVGMKVHGIDRLRLLKGVTVADGETVHLRFAASKASRGSSGFRSSVELHGVDAQGKEFLHATAEVLLVSSLPATPSRPATFPDGTPTASREAIYRDVLFHGQDLQAIVELQGVSSEALRARAAVSPSPSQWIRQPLRNNWLTDPLAIDSAFQLAIVWGCLNGRSRSLPTAIGEYRQYRSSYPPSGVDVAIRVTRAHERGAVADIDLIDSATGDVVATIDGYECVADPSLDEAFRRNRLGS